jgi:hypothetical protein
MYFRTEENVFSFFTQLSLFQKFSILQSPSGENVLENTAPWSILEEMSFSLRPRGKNFQIPY